PELRELPAVAADAAVAEDLEVVRRPSPTLELTKIFEFQIVELDEFTEIQSGLLFAVVECGKFSGVRAAVGELHVGLVPILKRQFPFDAFVMRDGDCSDDVSFAIPGVLLLDLNLSGARQRLRRNFCGEQYGEFVLRVGKPRAAAVVHDDVPLVPAALLVLIEDAAGDDERFIFVDALGVELDRRAVGWEVSDLADFFYVNVGANEDAFAVGANGLHAARPLKCNFGAAVWAVGDGLRHRRALGIIGISRSPPDRAA